MVSALQKYIWDPQPKYTMLFYNRTHNSSILYTLYSISTFWDNQMCIIIFYYITEPVMVISLNVTMVDVYLLHSYVMEIMTVEITPTSHMICQTVRIYVSHLISINMDSRHDWCATIGSAFLCFLVLILMLTLPIVESNWQIFRQANLISWRKLLFFCWYYWKQPLEYVYSGYIYVLLWRAVFRESFAVNLYVVLDVWQLEEHVTLISLSVRRREKKESSSVCQTLPCVTGSVTVGGARTNRTTVLMCHVMQVSDSTVT